MPTPHTRTELYAEVDTLLASGQPAGITATLHRQVAKDIVASAVIGPCSVDSFGAVGDGVTDDTAAITAALTAAGENGAVLFTAGKTYKTTSVIQVLSNGVVLFGYGATITSENDTQTTKFRGIGISGLQIRGFVFDCLYDSLAGASMGTIDFDACTDCLVIDCYVKNTPMAVRAYGACARIGIVSNRFFNNFASIIADNDGVNYATQLQIIGNRFFSGIGTTTTAYSGAIKILGYGNVSAASALHVISNNIVESAGQMGIEIQSSVNDCSISINVISGVGFGISIDYCYRTSVTGNRITACTYIGIEVAEGQYATLTGNNVDVTTLADSSIGINAFSYVAITGGQLSGGLHNIHIISASHLTFTGVNLVCGSNAGITLQGGGGAPVGITYVNISGCTFQANSTTQFVGIDATDSLIRWVQLDGNFFYGNPSGNGITFYSPASGSVIRDITISNNFCAFFAAGGSINSAGVSSPEGKLYSIRCRGNTGDESFDTATQNAFNIYWSQSSADITFPYAYWFYDGGVFEMDCTAAPRTFELPNANALTGYTITIIKQDSGVNAVTVQGYAGQTINGGASVSLASQFKRVTVISDNSNWKIIQSN